jgi:hypothetical protein
MTTIFTAEAHDFMDEALYSSDEVLVGSLVQLVQLYFRSCTQITL